MGSEPTLVPEWLRVSKAGSTSNANPDERGSGHSSRNRLSVLEAPRIHKTQCRDRNDSDNSVKPLSYSNFGRRGDRRKNIDYLDLDERGRPLSVDTSSRGRRDSILGSRGDADGSWSARFIGSGRRGESWQRSLEDDIDDSVFPKRPSFTREFPSLGADDKQTSVGNGPKPLSPVAASNSSGLNMAETLAQTPTRAQAPHLTIDTHRTDELMPRQSRQLRPLTPKTSVLNSSEKSKSKGARAGQEMSSQLAIVNNALRALISDVPKAPQGSNFQVLNRERNGTIISSAVKDVGDPGVCVRSPTNQNLKAENKGTGANSLSSSRQSSSSSFRERKSPSQAQNRINFFNSLRKKESANPSMGSVPDPGTFVTDASEKSGTLDEQNSGTHAGASVINQECEANGNGDVEKVRNDDDDASGKEGQVEKGFQSDCHVDDEGNSNHTTPGKEGQVEMGFQSDCHVDVEDNSNLTSPGKEGQVEKGFQSDFDVDDEDSSNLTSPGKEAQVENGFQSDCHLDDEDNSNQSSCYSDGYYDPVVVGDEKEAALLRSLGWDEHARVEAIKEEEIAAFKERYGNFQFEKKVRPFSKLSLLS